MIGAGKPGSIAVSPHLRGHWFNGYFGYPICRDFSGRGNHLSTPYSVGSQMSALAPQCFEGQGYFASLNTGLVRSASPASQYDDLHLSKAGRTTLGYFEVMFVGVLGNGLVVPFGESPPNAVFNATAKGWSARLRFLTDRYKMEILSNVITTPIVSTDGLTDIDVWHSVAVLRDGANATPNVSTYWNGVVDSSMDAVALSTNPQDAYAFGVGATGFDGTAAQSNSGAAAGGGGSIRIRNVQIYLTDGAPPSNLVSEILPWLMSHPGRHLPAEVWS